MKLLFFTAVLCSILLCIVFLYTKRKCRNPKLATVVTAFYPVKSKRSPEQYMEWASTFMKLSAPILLFTSETYAQKFQTMRTNGQPLKIIVRPFHQLYAWQTYENKWKQTAKLDHESYHSPELYAVWAQKMFFVAEAAEANYFNTNTFYWCDIGAFRDPNISSDMLATFPRSDILESISPAILMNSVSPLTEEDKFTKNFKHVDRLVGGLWGGTKKACVRWKNAYEAELVRQFRKGVFAGKDQTVMLLMYLSDPSLVVIVKPTVSAGNQWFFQQYLLSSANAPFERDQSYII